MDILYSYVRVGRPRGIFFTFCVHDRTQNVGNWSNRVFPSELAWYNSMYIHNQAIIEHGSKVIISEFLCTYYQSLDKFIDAAADLLSRGWVKRQKGPLSLSRARRSVVHKKVPVFPRAFTIRSLPNRRRGW
jgi:hypothetical protein